MADAIVSVVLEQLISIIAEEVEQEVRLVTGVEKEIEKLTSNFRAIQAVLHDAEQRRMKKDEAVGYWLDRLKDASCDMDDILDEWKFAIFKLQMEGAHQNPKKKVCSFFPSPRSCFKQVGLRRDIALRIREVNQNLDSIAEEKERYKFVINRSTDEPQRFKSSSFVDVSEIRGREEEKKNLVNKLLNDGSEEGKHPHVISIVGMGGIGKTTLAQLAYNDEEVIKKFDERIWVCVSDPFDEIRIAKAIIEGLKSDAHNCVELNYHLEKIHGLVAKKKFLLVLDDTWIEKYNWGPLYSSLNSSLRGSKILVTTRSETVSSMMKSFDIIRLMQLIGEENWLLFKQLAFSNGHEEECGKLENIGRGIVDKCKGLPLAVNIIGSLLRSKETVQQWQRILDNDLWNLEELEDGLFPPLLLSYNDLSWREKRCFSYCAVFPKDYKMDKNELIQLWMAQGYLGLEQSEELETIGQNCFDSLVMHSLFQKFDDYLYDDVTKWKMHDIVHDFAKFLVKNECLSIKINTSEPQCLNFYDVKTRHLMLILDSKEASFPTNKLRSLLINDRHYDIEKELLSSDIFEKLTCLRALKLSRDSWPFKEVDMNKMIPKEVGKLIHLRYLYMSNLQIKEIPETLCDLYNLQTLYLECMGLEKLPQGMGKLINLRHLIIPYCYGLSYMPKGFENLRCLRTLSRFVVGGDVDGSQACSLESLQNLNHLGGQVKLVGLGNVKGSAEAQEAHLSNKKNVIDLSLNFATSREASASEVENDGAVLEALRPPSNLEHLYIGCYTGTSFPEWMTLLTQLKSLTLVVCECEQLPALGKLPSLESLVIQFMDGVKRVGNELLGIENATTSSSSSSSSFIAFHKLKMLNVAYMREWEYWDDEITRQVTIMPSLCKLYLAHCHKLKTLPEYILHAPSLKDCDIHECPKLEKLPPVAEMKRLTNVI